MRKVSRLIILLVVMVCYDAFGQLQVSISLNLYCGEMPPLFDYTIDISGFKDFAAIGNTRDTLIILSGLSKDSDEVSSYKYYLGKPAANYGREIDYIVLSDTSAQEAYTLDSISADSATIQIREKISDTYDWITVIFKSHLGAEARGYLEMPHCPITSIYSENSAKVFIMGPNPAEKAIHIAVTSTDNSTFNYSIVDMKGKCILQGKGNSTGSDIDLENAGMTSGIYAIIINDSAGNNHVLKFIKN